MKSTTNHVPIAWAPPRGWWAVGCLWDDPPTDGNADPAQTGDDDPKDAPTPEELQKQLDDATKAQEKQAAENERPRMAAEKHDADKRGRADAERKRKEKEAAEKGEWEHLHREAQAELERVKADGATAGETLSQYNAYLGEQVTAALDAVEDKAQRATWEAALDGLDPLRQHKVLRALQSAQPSSEEADQTVPRGGAPGPRRPHVIDRAAKVQRGLAGREARKAAVAATLARGAKR